MNIVNVAASAVFCACAIECVGSVDEMGMCVRGIFSLLRNCAYVRPNGSKPSRAHMLKCFALQDHQIRTLNCYVKHRHGTHGCGRQLCANCCVQTSTCCEQAHPVRATVSSQRSNVSRISLGLPTSWLVHSCPSCCLRREAS